jgi:pimeloyl-ACP methyl ester carboxylesterase
VLFNGIGVDSRVYTYQRSLPVRLHTPEWIDPRDDDESLGEYSRRMAAGIEPDSDADPLYVGGLSFGGMVALEAARVLRPRGVFLISSCFSSRDIAAPVRLFGKLIGVTPLALASAAMVMAPLIVRVVGRSNRHQRRLLVRLLPDVHLRSARWAGPAILRWEFGDDGGTDRLPCPVHHIHGGRDLIVPLENVNHGPYPPPDVVLPEAGHALNITHAVETNRFILERMGAAGAGGQGV